MQEYCLKIDLINDAGQKLTVCIRFSTNFFAAAKPSTLLWLWKGERKNTIGIKQNKLVECPYHEPLYTGVLGITNGILHHSYSKNCGKERQ